MMKTFDVIVIAMLACAWQSPCGFADEDRNHESEADRRIVHYEDFGAQGNGKTDDTAAIAKAHEFANQHGLHVKANDDATYYIGGQNNTVIIQTDTDFGAAKFIIDDTNVENRYAHIFEVRSILEPVNLQGITALKRNQRRIEANLPQNCFIHVTDSSIKQFIRRGLNQNSGKSQTEVFAVDKNGYIDANTPIVWDFDQISDLSVVPMDTAPLTITGGHFTTIANQAESKYTYYSRGIAIRRSNVVVDGLEHRIIGEKDHGAPYVGFINIGDCAHVKIQNTILSGHKTYRTIGSAGKPVSMGSYDIHVNRALNVTFENCSQFNDIKDRKYWGIMASNFSKNLRFEHCSLSRFDAHMGVANATIRNSTLGHMGINAIGSGTFLVENTTVYGETFINLRSDYGSTWQGDIIIRDCVFVPAGGRAVHASLIGGRNDGQHDFGYTCYMPERIVIDTLHIDDSRHPKKYEGPTIFADFNPSVNKTGAEEKYPYIKTREVILKNVTIESGYPLLTSKNPTLFKDVRVKTQ